MYALVTCKNEEYPIKIEGARLGTTLYSNFSDAQGQITLVLVSVSGQALMHVLVTCKNEDDQIKNEGARVFTRFLPL